MSCSPNTTFRKPRSLVKPVYISILLYKYINLLLYMTEMTYLYRHYDKAGILLYVGISCNVLLRTDEHNNAAPWFHKFPIARAYIIP